MKHNFGAGPGILPEEVLKQASESVLNFNQGGLSLLEISHRTPDFERVLEKAVALVKELLHVPDGYEVLFIQGGASMQFAMVPYNLMQEGGSAAYLDTGVWANKAIKEAGYFGNVLTVASSKDKNYTYIPKNWQAPTAGSYFHITSNNTIYGTEMFTFRDCTLPMVSDMSSDIFSREIPVEKFGLIYAGAQKNMGPAGVTLVIVKKDILGKSGRKIPAMFNYSSYIENGSMYNTPPVFAIYVSMLTLEWLKNKGGVAGIEKENKVKSETLYAEIDRNGLFEGTCAEEDRSRMNVCFVLKDPSLESSFLDLCKKTGIVGIKGHRNAGGFRASLYNALPLSSVHELVSIMQSFEKNHD